MADKINFYTGTKAEFDETVKSTNGIYFVSDTREIYKGDVQYGGTATFIATPDRTGIVKPVKEDFDIKEDGTLSLHDIIEIYSFDNNQNNVEIGKSINDIVLSWTLNRDPSSILILKDTGETINVEDITDRAITLSNQNITSDTSFTLKVKDENGVENSAITHIYFLNGIYSGVNVEVSEESINNSFIETLTKTLSNKKECTFTVNPAVEQYIYFALPTRLGTPYFYVGGIEGGFEQVKVFNFTNSSGGSEQYAIYKSVNSNLGSTIVEVK